MILLIICAFFICTLNYVQMRECIIGGRNSTKICKTEHYCYAKLTKTSDGDKLEYGCYEPRMRHSEIFSMCSLKIKWSKESFIRSACCFTDMCNVDLKLSFPKELPITERNISLSRRKITKDNSHIILPIVMVLICVLIIGIIVLIFMYFYCRRRSTTSMSYGASLEEGNPMMPDNLHDVMDMTSPSSGYGGIPVLMQRTIACQIQLHQLIGKGRFGEVWRGSWRSEPVAVKVFPSREERSWSRESDMYQTSLLRHENLLGFIAADNKDSGSWTQLWLVTEFHENGSLFDFLMINAVGISSVLTLCQSLAAGLSYLHHEILGTQGKPVIAHRDIKSRNVLVKSNWTCCISDLGLAARYDSRKNHIDLPSNSGMGTKRYLPPEVLDGSFNSTYFTSYTAADIYSLGLVFWEICNRCRVTDKVDNCHLPYYDLVPDDPSLEDMRKVICDDERRPTFSNTWSKDVIMHHMCMVMNECWYRDPLSRLTSLRIKKKLDSLVDMLHRQPKI